MAAKKHKIGWLNIPGYTPETWNPIVGCSKVSEGCRNCYAERQAVRNFNCLAAGPTSIRSLGTYEAYEAALSFDKNPAEQMTHKFNETRWSGFTSVNEGALNKPLRWKKPRSIFVNSMGDLFHESTLDDWISMVWGIMAACPQHLFIVLTKRADRMEQWFREENAECIYRLGAGSGGLRTLPNVWIGVTAEDQEQADRRIPHLLETPAAVRFVSCEPMVGPVGFDDDWLARTCVKCGSMDFHSCKNSGPQCWEASEEYEGDTCGCTESTGIDWVICGGESGPGARPMNPDWARGLRDECQAAEVPFFFKQWGDLSHTLNYFYDVDSKRGGDFVDGRKWQEFPMVGKGEI
jgi:protein gp37